MKPKYVLNNILTAVTTEVYDKLSFEISNFANESEGAEYDACQFELNGLKIISRSSKITPKKVGQFVTFWKRDINGITASYSKCDSFDLYVINAKYGNRIGQFVFPKSELINKGIIATDLKDGKRGFRVYPVWDEAQNTQSQKTQKWQLNYFYEIDERTNLERVKLLYRC
ncbi:MepB family protein [Saprospiraceae bacterium]|nr:MepB family protein [Saprospiraceae bacterium]